MSFWRNIFLNTFKRIFTSWICWLLINAFFVLFIILIIILPYIAMKNNDWSGEYEVSLLLYPFLIAFFCSTISSFGTYRGEALFYLPRPVKRESYFSARLVAVMILGLLLVTIYFIFWVVIQYIFYHLSFNPADPHQHHVNIFDGVNYTSVARIIVPAILISLFSTTMGISSKFYKKGIFIILIPIFIGICPMLFWILYSFLPQTIWYEQPYLHLLHLVVPSIIFSSAIAISTPIIVLSWKYMRIKV